MAPPSELRAYWLGRSSAAGRSWHQATASSRPSGNSTIFDSQKITASEPGSLITDIHSGQLAPRSLETNATSWCPLGRLPLQSGQVEEISSQRPSESSVIGAHSSHSGPSIGGSTRHGSLHVRPPSADKVVSNRVGTNPSVPV